jgi:hypothetical protein
MHNGITLMGSGAVAAILFTQGHVSTLVIMYSINVFVTFSLSMIGMTRHYWLSRKSEPRWWRLALFIVGSLLCMSILTITVVEKFEEGAWRTLVATGACIILCILIHRHYTGVTRRLRQLNELLAELPRHVPEPVAGIDPDPQSPIAVILAGRYGGLGIHTLLNAFRLTPGYFRGVVFLSVAEVDSGIFKGARQLDALRYHTEASLEKYVEQARRLGLPAKAYYATGTDVAGELEQLCRRVHAEFPKAVFFAGKLIFQHERWFHRLLHNETAFAVQRRLQWNGIPLVILPTRVS